MRRRGDDAGTEAVAVDPPAELVDYEWWCAAAGMPASLHEGYRWIDARETWAAAHGVDEEHMPYVDPTEESWDPSTL